MAAPFDLPDVCAIHRPWNLSPAIATDVPCRQVPNYGAGRPPDYVATSYSWTHWVDFQPEVDIRDNRPRVFAQPNLGWGEGDGIRLSLLGGPELVLVVVWVEDRFTNTPKAYKRAYCIRDSRVVIAVERMLRMPGQDVPAPNPQRTNGVDS